MSIKSTILASAECIDAWLPAVPWQRKSDEQRLLILLVHSVYQRTSDPDAADVFPHERMTVDALREFVEGLLHRGYVFLSPNDVLSASSLPNKAALLTFDDGYFNFVHALPLLDEYQLPVTLFVCPGYLAHPQSFWWDAFYRNARSRGGSRRRILREMSRLRKQTFDCNLRDITNRWGSNAARPASDLDRPLTMDEFRDVARHPFVHIGNHTFHHTALPFQTKDCIRSEIRLAEEFFERELGYRPNVISYPNGDFGAAVIKICNEFGYQMGMTIEARGNCLRNMSDNSRLRLGRFMLSGDRNVQRQINSVTRAFSLSSTIRRMKKHRY